MKGKEKIVIIGGGFAGLNLVKKLDKSKFEVVLVDRNNYHSFPPLFYQIASSGLDPGSISFPYRRELRKLSSKGARYQMGNVEQIDVVNKTVKTSPAEERAKVSGRDLVNHDHPQVIEIWNHLPCG